MWGGLSGQCRLVFYFAMTALSGWESRAAAPNFARIAALFATPRQLVFGRQCDHLLEVAVPRLLGLGRQQVRQETFDGSVDRAKTESAWRNASALCRQPHHRS